MVKDLLGMVKGIVESLEDVTKDTPLKLNAWRRMKSQFMLKNESATYLKM